LANLLLDIIKKSGFGRIVSVTSSLHTWGAINWDDLKAEKGSYSPVSRYNQSKLANVMFTVELQRRLSEEGSDVTASCVHPGVIKTDLQRHSGVFVRAFFSSIGKLFMKNQEQGAATTLYAAIHPQANGVYFVDCAPAKPGNNALNGADSKRLWDISEDMVNLKAALMAAQGAGSKMSKKPPKLKAANSDEVEQI
jgi:WW domain-containing oxidoreductase